MPKFDTILANNELNATLNLQIIRSKSMNFLKKLTPFTLPFLLAACGNDDLDPDAIDAPNTYEFSSLTDPSAMTSVDYNEATTRLVLIEELEYLINSDFLQSYGELHDHESVVALLNRIYGAGTKLSAANNLASVNLYDNSSTPTPINSVNFTDDTTTFIALEPNVNLQEVIPGLNTSLPTRAIADAEANGDFIGWSFLTNSDGSTYPTTMIQSWFNIIATLATDVNGAGNSNTATRFSSSNINYRDLIVSFLSASIPYSEVANVHLHEEIAMKDNSRSDSSLPYTQLEHHWDMAFGYFGTLINAKTISLDDILTTQTESVNNANDRVFTLAAAAAQRDLDSPLNSSFISKSLINNALDGRTLITKNKTGSLYQYRTNVLYNWEKTIAATLIHHINGSIGTGFTVNLDHWSHMKAYALALQFNPNPILSEQALLDIHSLIGQSPKLDNKNYLRDLLLARDKVQASYNFSLEDVQNW